MRIHIANLTLKKNYLSDIKFRTSFPEKYNVQYYHVWNTSNHDFDATNRFCAIFNRIFFWRTYKYYVVRERGRLVTVSYYNTMF